MSRTDMPSTWDERAMLTTFLDYARATAVAKCEGLSAENAAKAPLPGSPLMTPGGLISHLRWVEHWWFEVIFFGEEDRGPWTDEDPDREMRIGAELPLAGLLAEYQEQSARFNELISTTDFSATAKRPVKDGTHVTLGWVLMHLIEETSRHNGHLDILREMADGTTGA
ncbi:DinB family protein [Streptomyces beijiangensis]|uniref:DinB family protein n=1 Tax=Streptomyces beijiangensis TaxID=163361 RepID=A0A939JLE5_9ACTN|nr:DinB family protein [Streptomyces beijiangensis]MBO0516320.1 DinB family protein [Streptomyces beijiangensis]